MRELLAEIVPPEAWAAMGAVIAFFVALYAISVAYACRDSALRGSRRWWAWGLVALLLPGAGLIAYLAMRPPLYESEREERELEATLMESRLARYGTCPTCGETIEAGYVACPMCGTQVRNVCPTCHRPLDAEWHVCPWCATKVRER